MVLSSSLAYLYIRIIGLINSAFRMLLIPFVSYGYAKPLLEVDLHSSSFDWTDLELSTFLTHVTVSYLTYWFAWIACTLKPLAFFVPMFLSTPISFIWYVISVEAKEIFPFTNLDDYYDYDYLVKWDSKHVVLIVASLLWLSQFLAFTYHLFQTSNKVLITDSDLFWMPRYNSIFLEQQMILNRKNRISGSVKETNAKPPKIKFSMDNLHIYLFYNVS